jgi:hypothetical protein
MTPVTLQQIADEWASKLLAGRQSIPVDWSEVPDAREDYVRRQVETIREQAAIAAAAWARRAGRDPATIPEDVTRTIARKITEQIFDAVTIQTEWDIEVMEKIRG